MQREKVNRVSRIMVWCVMVALLMMGQVFAADYSLWPKRPAELAEARKLVGEGKIEEACQLLAPIIRQEGEGAQDAQMLLGTLRMRQVMSLDSATLQTYTVKRGDTWVRVAQQTGVSLEMLAYLNQLMDMGTLTPGQVLYFRPTSFSVQINVPSKQLSVWENGKLIKAYPISKINDAGVGNVTTTVKSKACAYATFAPQYAASEKALVLASNGLTIDADKGRGSGRTPGFYLALADCNEVAFLMKIGGVVQIIRQ